MNEYYLAGAPLGIGGSPQPLVDDYTVEDRWKLTRRAGTVVEQAPAPTFCVGGRCDLASVRLGQFRGSPP